MGRFPFFYSYLGCGFCGTVALFLIFRFRHHAYPYAYWLYFLLGIVVEFAVLVEISDHLFAPFPAIRQLGRALTIIISFGLGLMYILPTILYSSGMHSALLGFALRASLTKAVILGALLLAAHYYGLRLGRNVAGLILGFSIYLGVNIANFAADQFFYHLYDKSSLGDVSDGIYSMFSSLDCGPLGFCSYAEYGRNFAGFGERF